MNNSPVDTEKWDKEIEEIEALLDGLDHIKDMIEQAQDDALIELTYTKEEKIFNSTLTTE